MLPFVSLVVPAKNEEAVIGSCLRSLLKLRYPKGRLEIVAAIADSTDRSAEIAKSLARKDRRLRVVVLKNKKSKAASINAVVPGLRGGIVGIFDADCTVEPGCLQRIVPRFDDEKVAGVAGALKSGNRGENLLTRLISIETTFQQMTELFLSKFRANAYFYGKNMFVRKSVFLKLGGMDEKHMVEDMEFSVRMRKKKLKTVYEPRAVTYQEEPESLNNFVHQRMRWARGFIKVWRMNARVPVIDNLRQFDFMHGISYYLSPFSLVVALWLVLAHYVIGILAPHIFDVLYLAVGYVLLSLLALSLALLLLSRIYFREPLWYLVLTPLWILLGNLYVPVIMLKALFDELTHKPLFWYTTQHKKQSASG